MSRKLARALAPLIMAAVTGTTGSSGSQAGTYDLSVDPVTISTGDFERDGIGFNGTSPGPVLRFTEGEETAASTAPANYRRLMQNPQNT